MGEGGKLCSRTQRAPAKCVRTFVCAPFRSQPFHSFAFHSRDYNNILRMFCLSGGSLSMHHSCQTKMIIVTGVGHIEVMGS